MERAQHILSHLVNSSTNPLQAVSIFTKRPLRVIVTGAAGRAFGEDQPIILHLLEVPAAEKALQGIVMELMDGSYPLLVDVIATVDPSVAFRNVDYAILVGAFPRKQGMERKDLLEKNASIFRAQGEAINTYASRNVKVLVVGNPANTNARICSEYAPSIPKKNFTALTRLDQHRAEAQIANKLQVPVSSLRNVIIWGNHSATQVPDPSHASVRTNRGFESISSSLDEHYITSEFVPTVQKRGAAVIAARGASSAMSAARAAVQHVRDWHLGTAPGVWVSMGVYTESNLYGAPKDVIFSFPVTIKNGEWSIVSNLSLQPSVQAGIKVTGNELLEERAAAIGY